MRKSEALYDEINAHSDDSPPELMRLEQIAWAQFEVLLDIRALLTPRPPTGRFYRRCPECDRPADLYHFPTCSRAPQNQKDRPPQ